MRDADMAYVASVESEEENGETVLGIADTLAGVLDMDDLAQPADRLAPRELPSE